MMTIWKPIPGETPIDISGLKVPGVTSRQQLSELEAENIRQAIVARYYWSTTRRAFEPFLNTVPATGQPASSKNSTSSIIENLKPRKPFQHLDGCLFPDGLG